MLGAGPRSFSLWGRQDTRNLSSYLYPILEANNNG